MMWFFSTFPAASSYRMVVFATPASGVITKPPPLALYFNPAALRETSLILFFLHTWRINPNESTSYSSFVLLFSSPTNVSNSLKASPKACCTSSTLLSIIETAVL
nr:MAG TPA: hypothetical protein [Caudoviricetes sp.]